MSTYDESVEVGVDADRAFSYLSDVAHLPDYLPPITSAETTGEEEVRLVGEQPDGGGFENTGYLRRGSGERTLEWGAEVSRTYSGHLSVEPVGDERSRVSVHLEFGPRSVEPELQEGTDDDTDATRQAVEATLETIRRRLEGEGGTPEPPAEPSEGANEAAREKLEDRSDADAR